MANNKVIQEDNLLEVKNIQKFFPGVTAVDGVSISIRRGEVHGLVGKNGAGKSTLINIISGIYEPNAGKIVFDGTEYYSLSPWKAKNLGIQVVPQEQQFQPYLSVAENLFIGSWPTTDTGFINFKEVKRVAKESLAKLNIDIPVERLAKDLTLYQRQIVAIARAIFLEARLIILDEPTPSLTATETKLLFSFVHNLAKKGITFIYISHYLNEVFEICERVSVLRDGQLIHSGLVDKLNAPQLIEFMIGKAIENSTIRKSSHGDEVLRVKNLTSYRQFSDISFSIHKGEILGVTGLLGCGAFDLAKSLFGLYPLEFGTIIVEDKEIKITSPEIALKYGVALLPDERRALGLIVGMPVDANINLSILNKLTNKLGLIQKNKFKDIARKYIELLKIDTPTMIQEVRFLSGGNQQKVVVSRLLNTNPKVLVMMDPTAGIDVEAKVEIHKLMNKLTNEGMAILLVSTDMDELLGLSDRVIVMHQGRVVKEFARKVATRHNILEASEGIVEAV